MTERYSEARPDAALFIDWDNLKAGLKSLGRQPNISSLLDAVGHRGRVVVARSYADWQQKTHIFDSPNLYAAGIEPVYVPVRVQGGKILKNSADVKLAVDCIDYLNTAPHLKIFFLVSGDSDLVHLVNFIRARGKRVVVIAVSGTLSPALSENVDELLMYDIDIDPIRAPDSGTNAKKVKAQPEVPQVEDAFTALTDLLRNRSNRAGSLFSWIGVQLSRRGWDHRALGFERFKDFMQEAQRLGHIQIVTRGLQDWAYLPDSYDDLTASEAEAEAQETENTEADVIQDVSVGALDQDEQRTVFAYFRELDGRSEYMIPPYIVSHLVRDGVLPSLSQSQLRSLVRDAIEADILIPSTHTVPHKTTGKPYELRTLRFNPEHPLALEQAAHDGE